MLANIIVMWAIMTVITVMVIKRADLDKRGRNVGTECETHSTLADKILDYLFANSDKVFSQRELSDIFSRSEQQIRQTCLNMVKVGKVDRILDEHANSREARYYYGINIDYAKKITKGIEKNANPK